VAALNRVQLARLDKLEPENEQRATEGAAIVKSLREERGLTHCSREAESCASTRLGHQRLEPIQSAIPYEHHHQRQVLA
jgi:hypothetical protein